jgi:hypothetical protein
VVSVFSTDMSTLPVTGAGFRHKISFAGNEFLPHLKLKYSLKHYSRQRLRGGYYFYKNRVKFVLSFKKDLSCSQAVNSIAPTGSRGYCHDLIFFDILFGRKALGS